MTRTEAIAIIEQSIPSADETTLEAAARLFQKASSDLDLPRPLTAEDLASIERGREDFKVGRFFTPEELAASLDKALAERRAQRAAKV